MTPFVLGVRHLSAAFTSGVAAFDVCVQSGCTHHRRVTYCHAKAAPPHWKAALMCRTPSSFRSQYFGFRFLPPLGILPVSTSATMRAVLPSSSVTRGISSAWTALSAITNGIPASKVRLINPESYYDILSLLTQSGPTLADGRQPDSCSGVRIEQVERAATDADRDCRDSWSHRVDVLCGDAGNGGSLEIVRAEKRVVQSTQLHDHCGRGDAAQK